MLLLDARGAMVETDAIGAVSSATVGTIADIVGAAGASFGARRRASAKARSQKCRREGSETNPMTRYSSKIIGCVARCRRDAEIVARSTATVTVYDLVTATEVCRQPGGLELENRSSHVPRVGCTFPAERGRCAFFAYASRTARAARH